MALFQRALGFQGAGEFSIDIDFINLSIISGGDIIPGADEVFPLGIAIGFIFNAIGEVSAPEDGEGRDAMEVGVIIKPQAITGFTGHFLSGLFLEEDG